MIFAAATLQITAFEPSNQNKDLHPHALGLAAAALHPALLEQASKRVPLRGDAAEVMALRKLPVLAP